MSKKEAIKPTIIFDFDGTLADTFGELVHIYNKIAPHFDCIQVKEKDIEKLRNKRPQDFMDDYNVSRRKLPFLIIKGRKILKKRIKEIKAFEGIPELILELKKYGYQIGILTSNSQKNIKLFLKHNSLEKHFSFIYNGKNLFGKSKKLKKILKEQKLKPGEIIMIGDETRDIEAAHKMKVPIIAVTWGFNASKVLQEQKPAFMAKRPGDIFEFVKDYQVHDKK
jgi:phosphoglycolate phosphatase